MEKNFDEVVDSFTAKNESKNVTEANEEIIDFLKKSESLKLDNLNEFLELLNGYLQMRTFFGEYELSKSDVQLWVAIAALAPFLGEQYFRISPHTVRWHRYISHLLFKMGLIEKIEGEKKAAAAKGKAKGGPKDAKINMSKLVLKNAKQGEVVTRFPPEPSGYLHVGHIKAALLNHYYAKELYNGKLIIRFDDTNPSKEKDEFVDSILTDIETVGIDFDQITYTSETLLKEGKVFVDDTPWEQMKEEKGDGIESKNRNNTSEENIANWEEMKKGSTQGQKCVVRIKNNMKDPNKCMRDPSIFRVNVDLPHHRTGDKYKVYPLYDFACPIVDSIEGVTHALRSSEYHDRNPLYDLIFKLTGLRKVEIEDFSRLNFKYVILSKRKLKKFIEQGLAESWSDPRMPTIRGIMNRGLTVEALRKFIISQDLDNVNTTLVEYDYLLKTERYKKRTWKTSVNRETKTEVKAFGDPNLLKLNVGDRIQLERKDYYIIQDIKPTEITLSLIPDGRKKKYIN